MPRNRDRQRLLRKAKAHGDTEVLDSYQAAREAGQSGAKWYKARMNPGQTEEDLAALKTSNLYGFSDLTTYNALTGNSIVSKSGLAQLEHNNKLSCAFNTVKG